MRRISHLFLMLLWSFEVNSKIIITSSIWETTNNIYHINSYNKEKIQIIKFRPNNVSLELIETIYISLPEYASIVQDVNILHRETPILLVLTITGQLFGINLKTKNTEFILYLNNYFGSTKGFVGNIHIDYEQNGNAYLIVTANAELIGVALLDLPKNIFLNDGVVQSHLKIILAHSAALKIKPPIKIAITKQSRKLFSRITTLSGSFIWELNLDNIELSKNHDFAAYAAKDFIFLALQQQQCIDAIAIYGSKFLKIIPQGDFAQNRRFHVYYVKGEDIQKVMIGPTITEALFSWYMVEKDGVNYFLRSNNFADKIKLPKHKELFLKHGEIILRSLDDSKLFTIHCRTGKLRELTILQRWNVALDNINETEQDFLFWSPELQRHLMLNFAFNNMQVQSFNLGFDKPKILSWRK